MQILNLQFLGTNLTTKVPINLKFIRKVQHYVHHGTPKLQSAINKLQSIAIFIVQKEYHQTLMKKSL